MNCSRHATTAAPMSVEFSGQESWSWLPRPPPGALPNPGFETGPPAFQGLIVWRLLIVDSISLIDMAYWIYLFLFVGVLVVCVFQEIGSFYPSYHICGHRVVYSILLLSPNACGNCSDGPSLLSHYNNLPFLFLFLAYIPRNLSILFTFFSQITSFWFHFLKNWFPIFNFIDFCSSLLSFLLFGFLLAYITFFSLVS